MSVPVINQRCKVIINQQQYYICIFSLGAAREGKLNFNIVSVRDKAVHSGGARGDSCPPEIFKLTFFIRTSEVIKNFPTAYICRKMSLNFCPLSIKLFPELHYSDKICSTRFRHNTS